MKDKWFIGKIKENEFLMNIKGEIMKCSLNRLPDNFPEGNGIPIIECPYNLTEEQLDVLKETCQKILNRQTLLLEGGITLRVLNIK